MTETTPVYVQTSFTPIDNYDSQVTEFQRLIAAKQTEVDELSNRLQSFAAPPIDAIAPGQLSPAERVEQVLRHQASEAERLQSVQAIQVVLDQARAELDSLKTSLLDLTNRQQAAIALQELDSAIASYNYSANEYRVRKELLYAVTQKNAVALRAVGLDPTIAITVDSSELPEFAIGGHNGRFYWKKYHALTLEEKLRIAVGH